jgi:hypothetical protein
MKSLKATIQESLIIESKELTIEVTLENGSTKKDAEKYANQYGITLINFTDDKNFGQIAMYTGSSSKLSNFTKEVFDNTIEDYLV